jgi:hypothetical protein
MIDRLDVLVGEWEMESSVEGRPVARGRVVYEWLEQGNFLVQHADGQPVESAPPEWHEHWPLPSTSIVGLDDTTGAFTMLYADARGVFRVYQLTFDGVTMHIRRDAPGFHQRFTGTLDDTGRVMTARWEKSADGEAWRTDFDMVYTRVSQRDS